MRGDLSGRGTLWTDGSHWNATQCHIFCEFDHVGKYFRSLLATGQPCYLLVVFALSLNESTCSCM
jgi:hypothetical protein